MYTKKNQSDSRVVRELLVVKYAHFNFIKSTFVAILFSKLSQQVLKKNPKHLKCLGFLL
jgi:hypothetical protein